MVGQVHSALIIIVSLYLCTHVELHFVVCGVLVWPINFLFSDKEKGARKRREGEGERGREEREREGSWER